MKPFIGTLLLVFSMQAAIACDFCNIYLGINPNDYEHSITIQNRMRSYEGNFNDMVNTLLSKTRKTNHGGTHAIIDREIGEYYNTTELLGKFFVTDRFQLITNIGYAKNWITENGVVTIDKQGIGDLMLLGRYQVYNTLMDSTNRFVHRILTGGGIKLPLGIYKPENDEAYDAYIMPGTGSLDFITSFGYLARYQKLGINLDVNYMINTENSLYFKFADRVNTTLNFFYQLKIKHFSIIPAVGVYYERANRDIESGERVNGSGGEVYFLNTGMDLYYKKIALNVLYQNPTAERLNDLQTPNKSRWTLGFTVYLN